MASGWCLISRSSSLLNNVEKKPKIKLKSDALFFMIIYIYIHVLIDITVTIQWETPFDILQEHDGA